ncbi:DNA-directed RNA polymerase subunit omega [Thermosediminibacter litoriperuensis]|uniref:DNA-directed RNA polymerase subunit omega n=1 Tax=Thermosediminibacter litoriperuensis TaxID=291989 RepID=A0A5S5B0U7_9FIRM|nr:DNA-directed RNA polymerase subunit omega [Thermosediminibacter litoriperuensis]TYP60002.1 DNA-directed RNA polymerase subunit omega [Thermosediminibacter litoriperuensis]
MMYPSIDSLTNKYESKYALVVAAAKRARQLVEGSPKLVDVKTTKPVSMALFELDAGKIKIERPMAGNK